MILSIVTKSISKNFLLVLCNVQRQSWGADACIPPSNLTHDLVCISPVILTYRLISPTYSQLIAHTVARLHPLTVRVWLAAGHLIPTLPEQGVLEEEVKLSLSSLSAGMCASKSRRREEKELLVCPLLINWLVRHPRLSVSNSHARWLTPSSLPHPRPPNGWHTAVLHWQALCSCTHAKAASWRTVLVSPAPDDSRRGSEGGLGRVEEDWGRHCFTHSVAKLDFSNLLDLNHHCLYSCVDHM